MHCVVIYWMAISQSCAPSPDVQFTLYDPAALTFFVAAAVCTRFPVESTE